MVPWLIPVALFWTLAALYLGGAAIHIEGGGGGRQVGGLLLHFAAYLAVYALLRAVLSGPVGPIFGGVVVPIVVTSSLLPLLAKLTFRVVGVRITSSEGGATA